MAMQAWPCCKDHVKHSRHDRQGSQSFHRVPGPSCVAAGPHFALHPPSIIPFATCAPFNNNLCGTIYICSRCMHTLLAALGKWLALKCPFAKQRLHKPAASAILHFTRAFTFLQDVILKPLQQLRRIWLLAGREGARRLCLCRRRGQLCWSCSRWNRLCWLHRG